MVSTFLQEVEGEEPREVADGGCAGGGQRAVEKDEGAAGGNLYTYVKLLLIFYLTDISSWFIFSYVSCARFTMTGNGPGAAEFPVILKRAHHT